PFSNDLTAFTFSLSECFDFFISFGFWCYKNNTFCPLLTCPFFGEGYKKGMFTHPKNGATRFQNKETGKSVVIDNKTYELLQVGGEGFKW
ncbi:MAG: hypothetical protein IKP54_08625, partial [Bacteroidales bacterium]|nr:hypothetical protein [Bacteroidales bacterium]